MTTLEPAYAPKHSVLLIRLIRIIVYIYIYTYIYILYIYILSCMIHRYMICIISLEVCIVNYINCILNETIHIDFIHSYLCVTFSFQDLAFWPGERLYSQYEEGDMMYFIRAGRVRLEATMANSIRIVRNICFDQSSGDRCIVIYTSE